MDLKARLEADMRSAMKAKEKERLSVLRMILSDIKNQEIKEQKSLEEKTVLSLLSKTAKMRRESIAQFREGGREDLVQKETEELEFVLEYLPTQLSTEELREIIQKAITGAGAASAKEMGAIMKKVMPEVAGRADGKQIQEMVREILS
jgi:uncharacterized protein YqeY